MSKGVIALQFLGRLGNCMFSYAFARAYAERHDLELQTDSWIGQKVFGLNDPPITNPEKLTKRCENTLVDGEGGVLFRSYCQQQKCLIYTRRDCLRWFRFGDEVREKMAPFDLKASPIVAHYRRGDYVGYLYPLISHDSYNKHHMSIWPIHDMLWVSEETKFRIPGFDGEMQDIPDFYIMANALVLLRANSSFSWWAGALNHGAVYSPIMDGLEGGKEHDVKFVRGNWPKFRSDLPFITDLHLPE